MSIIFSLQGCIESMCMHEIHYTDIQYSVGSIQEFSLIQVSHHQLPMHTHISFSRFLSPILLSNLKLNSTPTIMHQQLLCQVRYELHTYVHTFQASTPIYYSSVLLYLVTPIHDHLVGYNLGKDFQLLYK